MAIDKNTTLINNFSKGMNTDTSDAYLEDGSYRMAVNLRYTTSVGSNSGELHMIEGCTDLIDGDDSQIVKKATLLRDLGVIVTEDKDKSHWHVYIIDNGNKYSVANIAAEKDRVIGKDISIVCRYEDEDNLKLYIADGAGPIITVQLANKDEDGEYIEELSLNAMLAYPSALLDVPKFSGLITGNLKSGVYQYAYQLYKKHAASSEISVATKMIPLHKGEPSYTEAILSEGYEKDIQTDKGIKIRIPIPEDTPFNSLYIYRIHYKEVGQIPDIDLVYDEKIPENVEYVDFSDTGVKSISVISLEEYNAINGIHIIPKVIEAKDDFMFAANIDNDAPIYEDTYIRNWHADENVEWEFEYATLVGDTCTDDNCIKINKAEDGGMDVILQETGLRDFVGDINDENQTYANAYAQYALKSLRRGETYRYGIILYDKDGNASAVKYIGDITTKSWSESTPFDIQDGNLVVHPMGIRFTVNNLPDTVSKYEIVRCGRDVSDISTITQCVLSRPIQRTFELTFEENDPLYDRPQSRYPLTPTGLITTQDYVSGLVWYTHESNHALPVKDSQDNLPSELGEAWNAEYTLLATNTDILDRQKHWDVTGNKNIFLIISPEYSYQSESLKDVLLNAELEIVPVAYVYPDINRITSATWRTSDSSGGSGSGSPESAAYNYYDIGNEYAHFPVVNNTIVIDSRGGTILSYYINRDNLHDTYLNNDLFNDEFRAKSAGRHSYIKMYGKTNVEETAYKIQSTGFPDTLSWDDFASPQEQYLLKYIDKVCAVGGTNFTNWVSNGLYNMDSQNEQLDDSDRPWTHFRVDQEHLNDTSSIVGAMMGPGGKCFVAKLDTTNLAGIEGQHYFGTYLCNIKHKTTPYGGNIDVAKENSTYRSFGDLFTVDTEDSTDTTLAPQTCVVFDGDCYVLPFEYVSQHKWYHPYLPSCRNACIVYSIPMETNINIPYTCGYEFSKHIGDNAISNIQDQPANVNNIFTLDKPLYAYDTVNNTVPTAKTLIAETDEEDMYDTNMDYRVYHSEKKSNNERTDSWIRYKAADYIDVDNRYGPITGLRKFNNSLIFWQQTGTGVLLVNERAQITDDSNLPLILGTGGVLGRYDYVNTKNGMREGEFADTQSDNMLYWWDHDRKQILSYASGVMAQELSKIKFVQSFFSNCDDVDDPVLFFDKLNNEAVFKVSSEGSVVFNENTGLFTGLYTISPSGAIILPSSLLLVSNDATIKTWNSLNDSGVTGLDGTELLPKLKYVVNSNALMTKTFDNTEFGGRIYGGGDQRTYVDSNPLKHISFDFYTPMKQHGNIKGDRIDNTEYNFRFAIPRADDAIYGGRLRGKTMEVVMLSDSNNYDFSLLFILTKYRISWT